jgi:hypothetical protein
MAMEAYGNTITLVSGSESREMEIYGKSINLVAATESRKWKSMGTPLPSYLGPT